MDKVNIWDAEAAADAAWNAVSICYISAHTE